MYNTGNPVPSSALEDMADNAQTFDALVTNTEGTTTDRLGNTRRVFQQILMDMGFQPLSGSFQTGATITARNQTLYDEVSHVFYAWGGSLPKVVPTGSTPATAGGVGVTTWKDKTDLMLRGELQDGGATIAEIAVLPNTLKSSNGSLYIGGAEQNYNTVTQMLADAALAIGNRVRWAGYYNIFDGGGNRGVVVAAGTGTADGGSFFTLSNGLQVKADMSDAIIVNRWGPVNPNAHLAFAKAIAYAASKASSGAFGAVVSCAPSSYFETSAPIVMPYSPTVGTPLDLNRSTIKKVTNTKSGLPSRSARGGTVTDIMDVDAALIFDHADNAYYIRGGIHGDGYIRNDYGAGVYCPRSYMMNFDEVTIDAPNGEYGFKTFDTFMSKFSSVQCIGSDRGFMWSNDGTDSATGTTCAFSRCWAYNTKVLGWDMFGLLYSSYNSIAVDHITTAGAIGAYRFWNCTGSINGIGAENTNTHETFRFIGSKMQIAGVTTFSVTASGAWLRATDSSAITLNSVRSDNVAGAISNGTISADTRSVISYDGTGPANGARKHDNTSRLNRDNELTGYIMEADFSISGGVLTTNRSDNCSLWRSQAGVYVLTFAIGQTDTNYRVEFVAETGDTAIVPGYAAKWAGGVNLTTKDFTGVATDCVSGSVKIFR